MNSKNFNASQKYFEKKRIEMQKEVDKYKNLYLSYSTDFVKTKDKLEAIEEENQQLKEWVERLLQYTELSKEDIKKACDKDKSMGEFLGVMKTFSRMFNY